MQSSEALPLRQTPRTPTRKTKRKELCNLLEQFYYSDDGTMGLVVDTFNPLDQLDHIKPTDNSDTGGREGGGEQQQGEEEWSAVRCHLHPQTRQRNGRCPLCSALCTKELKKRGSCDRLGAYLRHNSSGSNSTGSVGSRRAGSTGSGSIKSSGSKGSISVKSCDSPRRKHKGRGRSDSFNSFDESDLNSILNGKHQRAASDFDDLLLAHGGELGALAHEALSRGYYEMFDDSSNVSRDSQQKKRGRSMDSGKGRGRGKEKTLREPQSPSLEYSLDQLLDPKWADALRQISAKLSSRHSIQSEEEDYTSYRRSMSRSMTSLDYQEVPQKHLNKVHPNGNAANPHLGSLSQLRKVVEMATKSVGRFTPWDDDTGMLFDSSEEGDNCDDGKSVSSRSATSMDARSVSSMAMMERKTFAESKGMIFPVNDEGSCPGRRCGDKRTGRKLAKSLGAIPSGKGEGFEKSTADSQKPMGIVKLMHDGVESSGSDSSLTFSLCSKGSFGSSASINPAGIAYGVAPSVPQIKEKVTVSPTSVAEEVSKEVSSSVPASSQVLSAPFQPKEQILLGPPFDGRAAGSVAAAASFSEEEENLAKELKRAAQRQVAKPSNSSEVVVEDVYSDSDEDEKTVYAEPVPTHRSTPQKPQPPKQPVSSASPHHGHKSKQGPHTPPAPAAARPSRREAGQSSFFSALVQNARSRSKSRSRASRSKSRGRKTQTLNESTNSSQAVQKAAAEAAATENVWLATDNEWYEDMLQNEVVPETTKVEEMIEIDTNVKVHHKQLGTTEVLIPSGTEHHAPWAQQMCPKYDFPPIPPGVRGPIVHPHYKLGDIAREEDMIKFPKSKSRKGRRSRRSRKNDSDDDDSDGDKSKLSSVKDTLAQKMVTQAIGQLCHLDAAFVRRSDGSWTYALVADGDENEIRFVVSDKGSTKKYPKNLWESSVRRIRVLTQREGDHFVFKEANANGAGSRKKRSIGRGRSKSKGKGRLVSPSPTRRNVGVLNIPSTILEETRQYQHGRH